jgi:hypothetical protein
MHVLYLLLKKLMETVVSVAICIFVISKKDYFVFKTLFRRKLKSRFFNKNSKIYILLVAKKEE